MCGISGIIGRLAPEDDARVAAAADRLYHRGPDDGGLWRFGAPGDAFGAIVGHRRLAIIDLRHVAAQPMVNPDTGDTLIFNGEIYNFKDLRAELEGLGEQFLTHGDSEVILRGYARWGESVVRRLRGMFAIVLVDKARRSALLARDGMGIKPLYTTEVRDARGVRATAFASEGRALVRGGFAAPTSDPTRVYHYLWSGFSVAPLTIWKNVCEFPRGSVATLDADRPAPKPERFWQVGAGKGAPGMTAAEMLEESVSVHLVSDVPKVAFLSGGVDSSAVVGLARKHERQLETMSLGFAEHDVDETRHAVAVAAAAGTRHHSIVQSPAEMLADLDKAIAALDQPSFDGINVWLVSRAARELGFKVGLAGTGGDELAGGYSSFRRLPALARLLAGPAGKLAPLAVKLLGAVMPAEVARRKLGDLAATGGALEKLYQTQYGMRTAAGTGALLADRPAKLDPYGIPAARMADIAERIEGLPPERAITILETELFLGDRLLRDADTMSMDHSLELRVPFVDTVLSDQFDGLSIAQRYTLAGRKPPIREAAWEVAGKELIERPKRGFELPIEQWLRGPLRATVEATLLDRAACLRIGLEPAEVARNWHAFLDGRGIYYTRIWMLFVLLRWAEINAIAMG